MEKISVIVVDDHPVIRYGIGQILMKISDIDLVAQAANAKNGLELCSFYQPTVLLLDLNIPDSKVCQTIASVQKSCPQTQILILTAYLSSTEAQTLVNNGVAGYMLKEETAQKVVEAIRTVAEGKTWFSQRVIRNLLQPQTQESEPTPTITLSERENEVLELMVAGKSNQAISQTLHISARMVRRYLRQIYDKLGVDTRVEAAVRAVRLGLVEE